MGTCASCGTELGPRLCPKCGEALTRRKINTELRKYSYPMLGGLFGIVIANRYFPLVDRDVFLIGGVCVFFAPMVFHVFSSVRKRLEADVERLQRAYLAAGAVTVFLGLLMAGNATFDHSEVMAVRTTVVYKQTVRGRSGPSYTLRVRSWRPGRGTEDLGVSGRVYESVSAEKEVVVELHRGAFGLPWYSGVYSQ